MEPILARGEVRPDGTVTVQVEPGTPAGEYTVLMVPVNGDDALEALEEAARLARKRRRDEELIERINASLEDIGEDQIDPAVTASARRRLAQTDW